MTWIPGLKNCRCDENGEEASKTQIYPAVIALREQHSEGCRTKTLPHPPPDDAVTLVSLGDVGLGREFENLTVRYCCV